MNPKISEHASLFQYMRLETLPHSLTRKLMLKRTGAQPYVLKGNFLMILEWVSQTEGKISPDVFLSADLSLLIGVEHDDPFRFLLHPPAAAVERADR